MTLKKQKIAITGGIGSGKSSVAEFILQEGYPVFSCDEINRSLLSKQDYLEKLQKLFPEAVTEGTFDKKKLAETVFSDKEALARLNAFSHPRIMKELFREIEQAEASLVFAEIPLLFEEGYETQFDKVIVVFREEKERISSVVNRDGISEEAAWARIQNQYDYNKLSEGQNLFILKNEGTLSSLKASVLFLLDTLANS